MRTKLLHSLSVNTVQLVLNQVLGLVIFYVLSAGLDKNTFGQINLALAVLLAAFNILSFGIDQLVVKKVAAGADVANLLSLYIVHVLIAGLLFFGIAFTGVMLFAHGNQTYNLILLISLGKLMIFFSTPFKQAANGLEKFRPLAYMLTVSNFIRATGLIVLAVTRSVAIKNIIILFICGDTAELLIVVWLFRASEKIKLKLRWDSANYKLLLRESLPQTGVVLITSALARFDWIFIGFVLSAVKLAEYSFAYKIFELSTLPLLAIAPLLIPLFTRLFKQGDLPTAGLDLLIRAELMIAALTGLLINICWTPVADLLTGGKYGLVNERTIFLLSLCMPFLYLNNFLWTIYFVQNRLKMILASFIITLLVNVIGDIILIPIYKNEGAAFAFLLSCAVQTIIYLKKNDTGYLTSVWRPLVLCTIFACLSGMAVKMLFQNTWLQAPLAVVSYAILLVATRQIKLNDKKIFTAFLQ